MRKLFKFLRNLVVFVYLLIVVLVIVSILSYNQYGVTQLRDFTLINVNDRNLEPKFVSGDLLIASKGEEPFAKTGDEILFYKVNSGKATIEYSKVSNVDDITGNDYEYTVEGGNNFLSSDLIGKTSEAIVIPKVGRVLDVLQSKQGFFYLVLLPLMIAFIYTLYLVVLGVIGNKSKDDKKDDEYEEKKNEDNNEQIEKLEPIMEKTEAELGNGNTPVEPEVVLENKEIINNNETFAQENKEKSQEKNFKTMTDEERKALIQAKLNSMTDEEKKALVQAKLNSMSPEERKAFIEERKRKLDSK